MDCGANVRGEFFIIHHALWAEVVGPSRAGKICVPCLEVRMGRRLEPADFMDVPGNDLTWRKTPRLRERMGPDRGLRSLTRGP
jgi:hypothetical protein